MLFDTDSARIKEESYPILDAVSATIEHHPEFVVIEIAGHADERASYEHNNRLTRDRARAVLQALGERDIDPDRLISQGYGEYCPLAKGHNHAAWDKNRRVEFKVVKSEAGLTGVERGCPAATAAGQAPPTVPAD